MFKKDLPELVQIVKYRNRNDKFQNEMKDDINKIKSSLNVFIPADKTTNMYELTPKEYKKPSKKKCNENLRESITATGKSV